MDVYCDCVDDWSPSMCVGQDPLIINLDARTLHLTGSSDGVRFDLDVDGLREQTSWTSGTQRDAFLVLDRNMNGIVDDGTELFGDLTPQLPSSDPNGFRALAVFDDQLSGGNEDGRITSKDLIYDELLLWIDSDHDGFSQSSELSSLSEEGVEAIDLHYEVVDALDAHGNLLKLRARVGCRPDVQRPGTIWDVLFIAP